MTVTLGVVLSCFITTAPLLIAVAAAVFSSDPNRRSDARRVVSILRKCHTPPHARAATDEIEPAQPPDRVDRREPDIQ